MALHRPFHLERRDVLAAPTDGVLDPVDEHDAPITVDVATVTRVEPEVAKGVHGGLRVCPVALEDRVGRARAGHDLAVDAVGDAVPELIVDRQLDVLALPAHRPTRRLSRLRHAGESELGRAVHLDEVDAEALLEALDQLGRRGRAERHPHVVLAIECRWGS